MVKRREFIKRTGMAAVAATIPGLVSTAQNSESSNITLNRQKIKTDNQWDVIVVGGGPAGCAAACAAAREGAKVLLVESTGALGGMVDMLDEVDILEVGTLNEVNPECPLIALFRPFLLWGEPSPGCVSTGPSCTAHTAPPPRFRC